MAEEKEYILIGSLFGVELFVKAPVREDELKRIKKSLKDKYFTKVKKRPEKKEL